MLRTLTLPYSWAKPSSYCGPAPQEIMVSHLTSPRRDQNSKFRVQFLLNAYRFCTIIKWKNLKSNHCKLGIVCMFLMWSKLQTSEPQFYELIWDLAFVVNYWFPKSVIFVNHLENEIRMSPGKPLFLNISFRIDLSSYHLFMDFIFRV